MDDLTETPSPATNTPIQYTPETLSQQDTEMEETTPVKSHFEAKTSESASNKIDFREVPHLMNAYKQSFFGIFTCIVSVLIICATLYAVTSSVIMSHHIKIAE